MNAREPLTTSREVEESRDFMRGLLWGLLISAVLWACFVALVVVL